MHELSLAGSVLQIVEGAAARDAFARVRRLNLVVPALAGVEIDALRFALASIAPGTVLEAAEVVIERPASAAHCPDCDRPIEVAAHEDPCPTCGGRRWRLERDAGIRVVDLLVDPD